MKQIPFLLFALLLLASGAGCIGSWDTDTPKNVTSAPVIHYERGNVSTPINVSGIPVRGFDVNATEVIEIVLADPRTGILLEGGWQNISIRTGMARSRGGSGGPEPLLLQGARSLLPRPGPTARRSKLIPGG